MERHPVRTAEARAGAGPIRALRVSCCRSPRKGLAWLRRARRTHTPWLAIDDVASLWAPGCENLLLIDGSTGLTAESVQRLRRRLREGQD